MKKVVVISFLTLLIYNSVGFVVSFRVLRHDWKQQVRVMLANSVGKNDLKTFQFHKNDALANENEFQIEGHFYDVFERAVKNDSVIVKCFSDEKETQLVSEFQHDIHKNITQKSDFQHKSKAFFSFLIKDFIFDNVFALSPTPSVSEDFSINIAYLKHFFTIHYIAVLAPPPRFAAPVSA